jgi:hypothetical protein
MRSINRGVTHLLLAGMAAVSLPANAADPSIFKVVPAPAPDGMQAMSASSPSDIWAVGIDDQFLMHFDGAKWTSFSVPFGNFLSGVAAISPTEAWAVGTIGAYTQTIFRWDGTQWSLFPGPVFAAGDESSLVAMTAISADDIWAVGWLLSDNGARESLLVEHWDGTAWTPATVNPANAGGFLSPLGIFADATNDVWVVGYSEPEVDNFQTSVLHYDGTSWKNLPSPNVGNGPNELWGVQALAPDNVWAVGYYTPEPPPAESSTLTLIEHWDGTSWTVVPSPNIKQGTYYPNELLGITAVSATDIWAFGDHETTTGRKSLLEHWDGTAWSLAPCPSPGYLPDTLFGGVAPSPGNVWLVGAEDDGNATLLLNSTTAGPN